MAVRGADVATQFAALPAAFRAVTVTRTGPHTASPDGTALAVPNAQAYTTPLGTLTLDVVTTLTLGPDGRVVGHSDAWTAARVGGVRVPIPCHPPRLLRSAVGSASSLALRALGVGGGGVAGGVRGALRRAAGHTHQD